MGWSAGLTLVKVGGVGMPWGSRREAWVMAACTSTAAPSSLRARSNSSVIWVLPSEFELDIEFRPAMALYRQHFASHLLIRLPSQVRSPRLPANGPSHP